MTPLVAAGVNRAILRTDTCYGGRGAPLFFQVSSHKLYSHPQNPILIKTKAQLDQQSHGSADGGGISTSCGAVTTPGITVLVGGSELKTYGRIFDPGK